MSDPEAILDALAAGLSVEKAAKHFNLPVAEVRQMLRDEVERCRDGEHLREVWALADRRLAAVEHKFYLRALEGDGDPQSAIVFCKTNERRATLAGANAPAATSVRLIHQVEPAKHETSTERLNRALDNIAGITPRERELTDRHEINGDNSPELLAELDELRTAREQARAAKKQSAKESN